MTAELANLLFNTIIPIAILSIPFVVVIGLFISTTLHNRRYSQVLRMDNGFTFLLEPNGNILIKPRGWFSKVAFVIYGLIALAFIVVVPLTSSQASSGRDWGNKLLVVGALGYFVIYSIAYWRHRPVYVNTTSRRVEVGKQKPVPFQRIAEVRTEDTASLVHDVSSYLRYGTAFGPLASRYFFKLILTDQTEIRLGSITVSALQFGNRQSSAQEIEALLKQAILADRQSQSLKKLS
jgi:hypothetical protein